MFRHILIATDGSEASERAILEGMSLAREQHARVTLVTASPSMHALSIEPLRFASQDEYRRAASRIAESRLRPWVAYAREQGVAADTAHVYADHPAQAIVDTARRNHCDLVVMGTRGNTGLKRAILGSQAREVLGRSTVPVLICR